MMLSRFSGYADKGIGALFPLFLFLSTLFCGFTKVNNLFHLCMAALVLMIATDPVTRRALFADRRFNTGLLLSALMMIWFSLSNLWAVHPGSIASDLTHSLYLLMFMLLFRQMVIQGRRTLALSSVAAGMVVLLLLTFALVDTPTLLTGRLEHGFFAAPENVIDLAGFFAIGLFLCLILIRDTGHKWLYLPVVALLIGILLTQSRGPLLAMVCALAVLFLFRPAIRPRHLLGFSLLVLVVLAFLIATHFGDIFLGRVEDAYGQSFVRFGIWRHALSLIQQRPLAGWGINQSLSFINSLGDPITTTHSLYLGTLLKGGIVGLLLLLLLIAHALVMAKRQLDRHQGLEGALFLLAIGFYITQGMFFIGNPDVSWFMFWLPLAVVLTLPTAPTTTPAASAVPAR